MKAEGRSLFAVLSRTLILYSVAISLFFLLGLVSIYHLRLREQRADAAQRINLLLQVSLENAMLKRDIPGLMEIVTRLGQQPGIEAVAIVNPEGEVRFASRPELLGRKLDFATADICPDCRWDGREPIERSELLPSGLTADHQVLRSIKTVANREACGQCHGDPASKPVNGLLIVDHSAQDLRQKALSSAFTLAISGLVVLVVLVGGISSAVRRHVLQPIANLQDATEAWGEGRLSARALVKGSTEFAHLAGSFNQMAERVQTSMAEIRARERFVEALIEALPDGIRVIDRDFRITRANKAYHRIHGLPEESAVGTLCYISSHGRQEPCISTLCTCPLSVLRIGDAPVKYHATHVVAGKGDITVEVHAARIGTDPADARQDFIVEVIRDLDTAAQISHEQRLSELGQLATGIAHEIRNPLSSVAILLHEAEMQSGRLDPAEMIRLISQEVERCLSITESLLKLGTPPAHEPELIDIRDLITDMLQLMRYQAEVSGVTFDVKLTQGLRILAADSDMRIVVINLIQNAFHAMPSGGTLHISAEREDHGKIIVRFADTGIGIPATDLRSIFLPFWSRRADGVHGTGLGLSICRSILHAIGGEILVSSVQGKGTIFSLEIPDADFDTVIHHVS